ncbi:hypothetical protein [Streptomyces sp. RFCAC02]|uniref:hypothetical protein n=1 Tax=Streptomyces sp. RFCAC02 TaxID=2499143 RepID=UPI00101EBAD1|nr:hypothetical protein [Streptomyces sp. RFCAC02]
MSTRLTHRRAAAVRCLSALALGLAALTGCAGEDDDRSAAATPTASTTPPAQEDDADSWAGTLQFVQIEEARTSDGRTYLSVRPARKEAHVTEHSEAWVVVPGEGDYAEVPMAEDAEVLLSVPLGDDKHAASYSQAEFVSRLMAQSPSARSLVGYDLSFDGDGRVIRLQSLYTS